MNSIMPTSISNFDGPENNICGFLGGQVSYSSVQNIIAAPSPGPMYGFECYILKLANIPTGPNSSGCLGIISQPTSAIACKHTCE